MILRSLDLDLKNNKFGLLKALRLADIQGHGSAKWLCVCKCGAERVVRASKLRTGEVWACHACSKTAKRPAGVPVPLSSGKGRPSGGWESEFMREWERYLNAFTPAQVERFKELTAGRPGSVVVKAEAVDVVMREPAPGVCCLRCLEER